MFCARKCLFKLVLFVAVSGSLIGCPPQYQNAQVELSVSPVQLDFGANTVTRQISITKNATAREMSPLSVTSLDPWILPQSCTNGGSTCVSDGPLDPLKISIRVDRSRMSLGENSGAIVVESPGSVAKTVEVYAQAFLVADFSADNRSPQPNQVVKFTDRTQSMEGPVISREWDFGDGTKSTAQDPTHIFQEERAYQVSLKVSTATRTETAVRSNYILVGGESPIADFTATPLTLFQGETVKFTDQSSSGLGQIKSWAWDFGDGGTSATASPYHTYETAGRYSVALTVANDYGSNTLTKPGYVFVQTKVGPLAAFMYNAPYVNQYIQFMDVSMPGSKPITSWRWNFGDPGGLNNISTLQNPKYNYNAPGTYHVTLTVSTEHGASTTEQDVQVVYAPLRADFTVSRTRALVNDSITFTDNSLFGSLPITARLWNFGDGTTTSETKPVHKYTAPGTYSVNLTVSTNVESNTVAKQALISVFERRPLDDFMRQADINYHYELKRTINNFGVTGYILLMTSQQWRTPEEINLPLWKHWVTLIVPPNLTNNTALLMVSGGGNTSAQDGQPVPSSMDETLAQVALATGSVVVVLNQVPSESIKFTDEFDDRYLEDGRSEDEIISYTYNKFFETYADGNPDTTWPALLPMAKSAVRAMDATQDFMKRLPTPVAVNDFVVTGASKRGWTTWLTGAYDHRVRAIAPIVIDVLNMDVQMDHHRSSYGFYSDAIIDYIDLFIFEHFDSADGLALLKIVDPFEYRERLIMPKLILNSTGDEFFLPDSLQFYFDDLLGLRHVNYAPNTNHGMGGYQNVVAALVPWYKAVVEQRDLPVLSWTAENSRIIVNTQTTPKEALLWTATSPTRDFRFNTDLQPNPPYWTSTPLPPSGVNRYVAEPTRSANAWTAFFIQFKFDSGMTVNGVPAPYIVSSECRVAPPTSPIGPKVNFYATKLIAKKKESIQFTDLTASGTSNVSMWEWSFGDDTVSNLRNPRHAYETPGAYSVTLTARSLAGEDTMTRTNYITVQEPTGPQEVPNVVGMLADDAVKALQDAGFKVDLTGETSTTVQVNRIIRQDPAGGEEWEVGTKVYIVKSLGSSTVLVEVPNIAGMERSEAEAALIAAGLEVGLVTTEASSSVLKDHVIRQLIAAGTLVSENTPVGYVVSRGAGVDETLVPDLFKMNQADAEAKIREKGLLVGTISFLASLDVDSGCVMMQSPAAGTTVIQGTKVNFTLSLGPQRTALDDYLDDRPEQPEYLEADAVDMGNATAYVLNMKSQDWRTTAEVNRPEWRHWLSVVVPEQVQSTTALLVVAGGGYLVPENQPYSNMPDWRWPGDEMPYLKQIAVMTKSVVALVSQVPCEPIKFWDEQVAGQPEHWRSEDEIIAYSFDKYLNTEDPKWPALFPMVMSAVRAMDTIQDYYESSFVEDFVVTGSSKRGWTTWLAGAADSRVRAIVPMVIDVLNMDLQMAHQYMAYNCTPKLPYTYGGYSDEVHDYVDSNIFARLNTEMGQKLLNLVDPYEYRSRLYMPKLIINATGDQFFLPDSSQFYIGDLKIGVPEPETALWYIPNTDHGMGDGTEDVIYSIATFFQSQLMGGRTPRYTWSFEEPDAIRVTPITSAQSAKVWYANAPYERDFRLKSGVLWQSQTLFRDHLGDYVGRVPYPTSGWTGFFVELQYQSPIAYVPYVFTTPVRVIPDALPLNPNGYAVQIYRDSLDPNLTRNRRVEYTDWDGETHYAYYPISNVRFLADGDTTIDVFLGNTGNRGAIWELDTSTVPDWLKYNRSTGTTPVGEYSGIAFTVDRSDLIWQPNVYSATVQFKVNGTQVTVPLLFEVEMPTPLFNVVGVDFGTDKIAEGIRLVNYGASKLNWVMNVNGIPRWLKIDGTPDAAGYLKGSVKGGQVVQLTARADRTYQWPARYTHDLTIATEPYPVSYVELSAFTMKMEAIPFSLDTTPTDLDFGGSLTEHTFRFQSGTLGDMDWTFGSPAPASGITVTQTESGSHLYTSNGGLGSYEAEKIEWETDRTNHGWQYKTFKFTLDRAGLSEGDYKVELPLNVTFAGRDANAKVTLRYAVTWSPDEKKDAK